MPGSRRKPMHIVVMGVSATGKTSVGELLAEELGCEFVEGDSLHPRRNIEKMEAGTPLTDEDRWPWLQAIADLVAVRDHEGTSTVVTCSALKRKYRDQLRGHAPEVEFLHLHGTREVIARRQASRPGHFMPASLLDSQFATLEALAPDEHGQVVDVDQSIDAIVQAYVEQHDQNDDQQQ